jgi:predicted acyl esterase
MRVRSVAVATALILVLSAVAADVPGHVALAGVSGGGTVDLAGVPDASFDVRPGVEQVTVTGAAPRAPLTLVRAATLERILTIYTDDLGQVTFQYVPEAFLIFDPVVQGVLPTTAGGAIDPGRYRIVAEEVTDGAISSTLAASPEFSVLSVDDHPDPSFYDQVLPSVPGTITGGVKPGYTAEDGFGYLETRDGTLLSVNVRLPDSDLYGPGPYPTVIQYSGYAPSKPGSPGGADAGGFLAGTMGFAYVGVNVRGSGCSGGVFDVFNAAQAADGYDVVETVARQPWVKHGRPGMIGLSYSGITQLYVAATRPPSLAAITPLSVIEDPWDQQWPGGIYNGGFTQSWLASRDDEAAGGAQWVKDRIAAGDTTCADNLKLRTQNIPFEAFARSLVRRPVDADARNLSRLARHIEAPVYLTGAWQDEQTGARFSVLLDDLDSVPTGEKKFTMFNGHHPDGFTPLVLTRWFEFLSFYVDRTVPRVNGLVRAFGGPTLESEFGVPGLGFEPDRFYEADGQTPRYGSYAASLEAYEQEPPVRVLFEVGASPDFLPATPGAHRQRFAMTFPSWPPGDAGARTYYLGPDGLLSEDAPAAGGIDRFAFDPDVLDTRYYVSGDWLKPQVVTDWESTADGKGLSYETPPLAEGVIVAGEGYLDLWVRSTGTDAPLEVVLSEVYEDPDPGDDVPPEEVRVQHGLLRAGFRTLDPTRSTPFLKEHLFYDEDYQLLTPGEFVNVQVPLFAVAHPFRPGSRLRVQINTPGGDAPLWSFESDSYGATTHDVARGGAMASRLVLPVLPSSNPLRRLPAAFDEQSERPPCGSLRGQPCRPYVPLVNEEVAAPPPTTTSTTTSTTTAPHPTATTIGRGSSTTTTVSTTTRPTTAGPPTAPTTAEPPTVPSAPATTVAGGSSTTAPPGGPATAPPAPAAVAVVTDPRYTG